MPVGSGLLPSSFSQSVQAEDPRVANAPIYMALTLLLAVPFFFTGGGGVATLHNVLTLIFRSLMDVPTICFSSTNWWVCPPASYNVSWLSRRGSCLLLCPLISSPVLLSFLRRSCRPEPRSFISLFHFCCSQHFLPNVRPLGDPLVTFSGWSLTTVSSTPWRNGTTGKTGGRRKVERPDWDGWKKHRMICRS
jgi:hypothetical protein